MLYYGLAVLAGFFSGSICYAYHLPKLLKGIDIVSLSDDHNPGAFNAIEQVGFPIGILALILELLKGYLPVHIASMFLGIDSLWFAPVIAAPVLGHASGILYPFPGGKSIAVSFGVLLGLLPFNRIVLLLAFWYVLFSVLIIIPDHADRSVMTFVCFAATSVAVVFISRCYAVVIACLIISAVVTYKHLHHFIRWSDITSIVEAYRQKHG